ncbi:MAG: inositol phosphatase [Arcobacter sp.]|nr:MAG: inositol phosphatase [Arcobacter sp.]
MFDYDSFTNAVIKANKELYEYISTQLSPFDLEESKTIGYGGDKTLNIDIIAEDIFIKHLSLFGDIFSEEIGLISSNSNIRIVIDPLDGSHNFLSQLPYYGSSVALQIDGITTAGYVANLANGTILYRDNKTIKQLSLLDDSEINIIEIRNPQVGVFERAYSYPKICAKLNEKRIKFRSPGAAALSLSYANNFNFVIFAGKVREFDVAAALHICGDLFIHQEGEFLIITKSEPYLVLIKEIIKE